MLGYARCRKHNLPYETDTRIRKGSQLNRHTSPLIRHNFHIPELQNQARRKTERGLQKPPFPPYIDDDMCVLKQIPLFIFL